MSPKSSFNATESKVLDPLQCQTWDALLGQVPHANFFHGSAWARVLTETYHFSPVYFTVTAPDTALSVLPIMEVSSWLTGRRGIALPFTDECEPLCRDPKTFQLLFRSVLQYARERSWKYVELRGGGRWLENAKPATAHFAHRLDLTGGEAALFAGFDQTTQRAIRKAERSGLCLEFSRDFESMQLFYLLQCKTRKRHGLPPQPFSFFANIQKHVMKDGKGWTVIARLGRVPVAGAVFFHSGRTAFYKYGASDESYQAFRPNNFVIARAIQWYVRNGFAVLDFGRSTLENEGLRRFKSSWGSQETEINYFRYELRRNCFVTAANAVTGWHNRMFRILPPFLSRLAGRLLYKHIA